jgi:hypothetical protein
MTEEQLSALLRLKRYEQPPAEYFDQLLRDIHQRQRAELLRRPLWRIALDRLQTLFSEHSMGSLSYAGAMAAVLVVGVGAIGLLTPGSGGKHGAGSGLTASVQAQPQPQPPAAPEKLLTLQEPAPSPKLGSGFPMTQPGLAPVQPQPRYVIDARPVSYEPSSSFKF